MAVQSPPSQQPLEDSLRMGQNVNTETLSMSAPKILIEQASNNDVEAQMNLAWRYQIGENVEIDLVKAEYWLSKAAYSGNSNAQTQYAIVLRQKNDPKKQEESVQWLLKAIRDGNSWAHYTLALQLANGIGVRKNFDAALSHLIMAKFGGYENADAAYNTLISSYTDPNWQNIYKFITWPKIICLMGPQQGMSGELLLSYTNDNGENNSLWFEEEIKTANGWFIKNNPSILDGVFSEEVSIKSIHVGRAFISNQRCASVTITLDNILTNRFMPIFEKPKNDALNLTANLIALIDGRNFVNFTYMYF